MDEQATLQLTKLAPQECARDGVPYGDYDTIIDSAGVEWFYDSTGHLDVFGSEWDGDSGYFAATFDEAVALLIDLDYIEVEG